MAYPKPGLVKVKQLSPQAATVGLRRRMLPAVAACALSACSMHLGVLQTPTSRAIPTARPWQSMIYAARVEGGVLLIDLGWHGAEAALREGLAEIGATPAEVTDVFLTHSHRDHIGAWRLVRHARFHLATAEAPLFLGEAGHVDPLSRAAGVAAGNPAPWQGEVPLRPFSRDTTFAFGNDTLRALLAPGHTPGSAAYVFRDVLFIGDAVTRSYLTGYRPSYAMFSRDTEVNRASLASLFERVRPYAPGWICTAHAKCARLEARLIRKVLR